MRPNWPEEHLLGHLLHVRHFSEVAKFINKQTILTGIVVAAFFLTYQVARIYLPNDELLT